MQEAIIYRSPEEWKAAFHPAPELSLDEWEAAMEKAETEWKAAYRHAFVEFAVSRGWDAENAGEWASDLDGVACDAYRIEGEYCPVAGAKTDVIECEREVE